MRHAAHRALGGAVRGSLAAVTFAVCVPVSRTVFAAVVVLPQGALTRESLGLCVGMPMMRVMLPK